MRKITIKILKDDPVGLEKGQVKSVSAGVAVQMIADGLAEEVIDPDAPTTNEDDTKKKSILGKIADAVGLGSEGLNGNSGLDADKGKDKDRKAVEKLNKEINELVKANNEALDEAIKSENEAKSAQMISNGTPEDDDLKKTADDAVDKAQKDEEASTEIAAELDVAKGKRQKLADKAKKVEEAKSK